MPYKPPICPAYAQSQCLTLSPIPEAKSRVTSPVLSCKSSLFSGFEWSTASALTPLMSQTCDHSTSSSSSCASPAILDRLGQLNLQQQQQASLGGMPGISSVLGQTTPTSEIPSWTSGLGLGFTFLAPPSGTITTPFNTPARPIAPKPIITHLDPAMIQIKLNSLGIPPLTPPYDEDIDPKEEVDDNTPLHLWLQYRAEEAKRREEYEQEPMDALMAASSPDHVKPQGGASTLIPVKEDSLSKEVDCEEGADDIEEGDEDDPEDIIILTQGKRISVQESCAIATLKRRSRLMGLCKEAGTIASEGLPIEMEVDEFGMKVDGVKDGEVDPEVNVAEIAMNEDRSSPKYSIFSPTSRPAARRSVSFAKPEVTQVKTFASSPLAPKSHKRKASASSLFNTSSSSDNQNESEIPAPRSTRSLSTSALSFSSVTSSSRKSINMPIPGPGAVPGRYKRARRSSSIVSSLAFTSNSLAPIFSNAFLKNTGIDKTSTTVGDGIINVASLKNTIEKVEESKEYDADEKENNTKAQDKNIFKPSPAQTLTKKRSFGISMSLSFRGRN